MQWVENISWALRVAWAAMPWYANMQILALAAFPFLFGVCTRLHDRGYALAKSIGLVLTAYLAWLLAHMPGIGFGFTGVATAACIVGILSVMSLGRTLPYLAAFLRANWRMCLMYEAVFLGAFLVMVAVRAGAPQITSVIADSAAEKFTDFAVLNSLLTSRVFPPHDAWVSGMTLNYYYFGHFLWAALIKLGSVKPEIGFNLGLASVFAYVSLLSLSLGYNLTRRWGWAFLCMFLVALSSNLDGFLQLGGIVRGLFAGYVEPSRWYMGYDFWRSSRAIENTINEFPAFSFVLGDLHAHLSSLVIFLSGLVLCVQAWRNIRSERSLLWYEIRNVDELFLFALVFGALYAANSWDVVTFSAVVATVIWVAGTSGRCGTPDDSSRPAAHVAGALLRAMEALLATGILALVGILLMFRSFYGNFSPPNSGFALVARENRSSLMEYCTHWFLLAAVPVALACWLAVRAARKRPFVFPPASFSGEKLAALSLLAAAFAVVAFTMAGGMVAPLTGAAAGALVYALVFHRQPPGLRLMLGMLLVFFTLSCFCEVIYLDDIFSGEIERINTVFKLYYGMWPLVVLAAVLALARVVRYAPRARRAGRAWLLVLPLVVAGGVYPVLGTAQRLGAALRFGRPAAPSGALDGIRHLMVLHPDDYAAILWIRAFTGPDARILEMPGKQYEYGGRVSTMTGRPSIGGWLYHEWGWRGDVFAQERDRRFRLAEQVYQGRDPAVILDLLRDDRIAYVVVGDHEREALPALDESKFLSIGELVFRHGGTSVYKLDYDAVIPVATVTPVAGSIAVVEIPLTDAATTATTSSETKE